MRTGILAAALLVAGAAQANAQQRVSPPPTGGSESIIRTPSSSNGSSYGTSGNVNMPTSMYPPRLQNYNNPAASYGRVLPPNAGNSGFRSNRR